MKATSIDARLVPFDQASYDQGYRCGWNKRRVPACIDKPGPPESVNFLRGYLDGKIDRSEGKRLIK